MIRGLLLSQGVSPSLAEASMPLIEAAEAQVEKKVKRKASAYSKKYGKAFKKVAKNSRKRMDRGKSTDSRMLKRPLTN